VKDPKTHQERTVPLDRFGMKVLQEHRKRAEQVATELDLEVGPDTALVTYDGQHPLNPDTVTHYTRRLARRCGVDTHLHALRHLSATQLIAAGIDPRTVAGRLGHADAGMTLRVYAHEVEAQRKRAAEVLGRSLSQGNGRRGKRT
jgi:integrase